MYQSQILHGCGYGFIQSIGWLLFPDPVCIGYGPMHNIRAITAIDYVMSIPVEEIMLM